MSAKIRESLIQKIFLEDKKLINYRVEDCRNAFRNGFKSYVEYIM